jgi:hypothetical protein
MKNRDFAIGRRPEALLHMLWTACAATRSTNENQFSRR